MKIYYQIFYFYKEESLDITSVEALLEENQALRQRVPYGANYSRNLDLDAAK
jgi:hypothetical protein